MRALVRWSLRIIISLVAAAVVALALLLAFLQTELGHDRVRRELEARFRAALTGELSIARVTRVRWGRVQLEGVTVRDASGRLVMGVEAIEVGFAPLALLDRRFDVREVVLAAPWVDLSDGLAGLRPRAKARTPDATAGPWGIELRRIGVSRGTIYWYGGGRAAVTLAGLDLNGRLTSAATGLEVQLEHGHGSWEERGLPVDAAGDFGLASTRLWLAEARLAVADSSVAVPRLVLEREPGRLEATLALSLCGEDVRTLLPGQASARWLAAVDLVGRVGRAGTGAPWELSFAGRVAGAPAHLEAEVSPDGRVVAATAALTDLVPARVVVGAPPGVVDARLAFRLDAKRSDGVAATLEARLGGELAGTRGTMLLSVGHQAGPGTAGARTRAEAEIAAAETRASVSMLVRTRQGRLVIDAGHLRATGTDLTRAIRQATGDRRPNAVLRGLRADGTVELEVSGAFPFLAARGRASLDRMSAGDMIARRAELGIALDGLPRRVAGSVEARADEAWFGGRALGQVRGSIDFADGGRRMDVDFAVGEVGRPYVLRGDAKVTVAARATTIEIGRLRARTRGLVWCGDGGQVILGRDGAVTLAGVRADSKAGRVELEGTLASRDVRSSAARLHVHLVDVRLETVEAALAPVLVRRSPWRGTVTLDLHLSRRGRTLTLSGIGAVQKLSWRLGMAPIDGRVDLELGGGRLVLDATAVAGATGTAEVAIELAAPRQVLDVAAWRRLRFADVQHARLALVGIDLRSLAWLAGMPPTVAGTMSGVLQVPAGADQVRMDLAISKLKTGSRIQGVHVRLQGDWDRRALAVGAQVTFPGQPALATELTVEAGLPRVLAGGASVFLAAPARGTVRGAGLDVARLARAFMVAGQPSGRLDATLELAGSLAKPQLTVEAEVERGRFGGVVLVGTKLSGRIDRRQIRLAIAAAQPAGGRLDVEGRVVYGGPPARRSITGRVLARNFDLAALRVFAPDALNPLAGAGGRLFADLRVSGRPGDLRPSGTIFIRSGSVLLQGGTRFVRDLELDARFRGGDLAVSRLFARSGEGTVRAAGTVQFAGLLPQRVQADVVTSGLPVAAGRYVVGVDVTAHVLAGITAQVARTERPLGELLSASRRGGSRAPLDAGTWLVQVAVHRGTLHMPPTESPELEPVGPLEDYVFVDQRARAERSRRTMERVRGGGPIARVRLEAPRGVRVKGRDVDAVVRADLELDIQQTYTAIAGNVEVLRGNVTIQDQRYDVVHARAAFGGELPPDPVVDVELRHEYETATIFINLAGRLAKPQVRLSSNPPIYTETQLLAFVMGGEPTSLSSEPATAQAGPQQRALGLASNLLAGQLRSQFRNLLPIDILRVEVGGTTGLATTEIQVGKWLTPDLLLRYLYRNTAEPLKNMNEVLLEYRFARRWLIEGRYGDRGDGSADLLWTKRY